MIIAQDITILHSAPETVSCELYNAGPPVPESLSLTLTVGDSGSGIVTTEKEEDTATCTWNFPIVPMDVNDLTDTVRLFSAPLVHSAVQSSTQTLFTILLCS